MKHIENETVPLAPGLSKGKNSHGHDQLSYNAHYRTCFLSLPQVQPWWQVDLGCSVNISEVHVQPHIEQLTRLVTAHVFVSDSPETGRTSGLSSAAARSLPSYCGRIDPFDAHQPYTFPMRSRPTVVRCIDPSTGAPRQPLHDVDRAR